MTACIGGKQPAGSVSSIVCSPGAGLLIESWALLPLMVTGVGSPSTVMVTCSPGVARVGEGKLGLQFVAAATGLAAHLEGNQISTWNPAAALVHCPH